MAYTLSDPFRPLRTVLRVCGVTMLLAGLLLLLLPAGPLANWLAITAPLWPVRLAGAGLLTLGVYYLLAAAERGIGLPTLVTCSLGNGLPAVVIVSAYLQQDMAALGWPARIVLVLLFVAFLAGAVAPLRYLRAEYQAD